jgi:hypothetical protein
MNEKIKPWMVVVCITEDGFSEEGVILQVEEADCHYWWIPVPPKDKHGHRAKHHIQAPRRTPIEELEARIDANGVDLHPMVHTGLKALSVAELEHRIATKACKKMNLLGALTIMRQQWAWIKPYVERAGAGMASLLDTEAVAAYANLAATKHRVSPTRVVRALRAYLIGGMRIEALLPAWDRSGAPGQPRFPRADKDGNFSKRPGRRNPAARHGMVGHLGIVATADVRAKLRLGYRQFKTSKKISLETAHALTLGKYWADQVKISGTARKITLLPIEQLPTIEQFRRHGPGPDPKNSVRRINIGEHRWERDHRGHFGNERSKLKAAGQCGAIDSTSDDQNLVLGVDRTVGMPASWNTKLRENYTGYIAGFYSGFERPSTLTSLITIALAADSKVAFCKRYGVQITEDDWIGLNFRRVRADNGELKSEEGIATMSSVAISAEFVKAYAAERKNGVESSHFQLQIGATHQLPGSTQGQVRKRGDANPQRDACLTTTNTCTTPSGGSFSTTTCRRYRSCSPSKCAETRSSRLGRQS